MHVTIVAGRYNQESPGKGHPYARYFKPRSAVMTEYNPYQNNKHRRKGHYNSNINRVAIMQRHVEQEDKQENPQRPAENHITPILALQFCGFKEYRGNPHQQAATHQTEHSKIHRGHPVRDKYFSHRYIDPEKYRGSQYAQIPLYKIPHSCFLSVLFTHDYIIIHILGQRPPK